MGDGGRGWRGGGGGGATALATQRQGNQLALSDCLLKERKSAIRTVNPPSEAVMMNGDPRRRDMNFVPASGVTSVKPRS
jgi:hypothetical protein